MMTFGKAESRMEGTTRPGKRWMEKQGGFTLIEIMVTLVIVGILATVAGTALVAGINGYMSARENDAMAQKSQLAMARLSRELTEFTTIPNPGSNAKASSIIVERLSGTGASAVTRTVAIGLDGQSVKIKEDGEGTTPDFRQGDVLIDNVNSLAFSYYRGASAWSPGSDDLRLLSGIRINLVLNRPDAGTTVAFSTTVHPRNNGNIGGAALPASPPDQSRYTGCFVATAAYGSYKHPMVRVLREFRDSRLVHFGAGRRFIEIYYTVGPALAGLIQERPWARLLTRLALTPLVFLAFFLTHFPLAVPVLIVASWITARAITRWKGGSPMNPKHTLSSQRGAVLIAVVVTMVIFATLGAVMLNLFTTSTHSQFVGNRSVRAYYLAEAGYRYAASQYLNATTEAARETALAGLHNRTFTLANNDGQFRFQVYPYWYKVTSTGGALLQASVVGQYPLSADSYENGSWVQIRDANTGNVTYAQLASANPGAGGDSGRVDFTKYQNEPWGSIPAGSIISPVALTKSSGGAGNQTVGHNGELLLEAGSGYRAFPRWNGVVSVKDASNNEKTIAYRELYMDDGTGTYKLRGITDPNASTMTNITIAPGTKIVLGKFVRLNSKGIIGAGQAMEASRRVDFYIPVGYLTASAAAAAETTDSFSNLNNWFAGAHFTHIGSQEITNIEGSPALHVTTTENSNLMTNCVSRQEFGIGLNWGPSGANIPFEQAWRAKGGFLSYDVQVKMAIIDPSTPDPDVYKHGISFALSEKGDSYGIGLYRQHPSDYNCDGLPMCYDPGIDLSLRGIPLIHFWSKRVPGSEYVSPSAVVDTPRGTGTMYSGATANFPPEGLNSKAIKITQYPDTGDIVRFLNTGGALPSPMVANQVYYGRIIYKDGIGYLYLFTTQTAANCPWVSNPNVRVCSWPTDGSWIQLTDSGTGTHEVLYDDPMWSGLAYAYLASASANKDYTHLVKSPTVQAMRKWVTLVVRMKEAPCLYFKDGGNANLDRIRLGDTVYQTTEGTPGGTVIGIGRVAWEPVYYSYDTATYKTWNGTARGALVLDVLFDSSGNKRPILFDKDAGGGKLFVGTPPNGVQLATVLEGPQDNGYMKKGTWVQVFFADPDDDSTLGSPNTTAFDQTASGVINRKKVERGTIVWPPDNVSVSGISHITEATDYFTMLKWYSGWADSFIERFYSEANDYYGAGNAGHDTLWIRNYASAFVKYRTPDLGSPYPTPEQRPEVGLHALGTYAGWSYFDDFALRLGGSGGTVQQGFLQPFQQ